MLAKEFIQQKLNELKSTEKSVLNFKSQKDLSDFIFKTLMSKKFRKFAITPIYIPHIQRAIENSIKNNLPIKLVFPFGAYKLWRLEEAPEADWAELFTLMYYAKWVKPIAEVYKPGVEFDFSSDEIVVERMNNITKADTDMYSESFYMIMNFLKGYLPENIKFSLTPVRSYYSQEEFDKELEEKINTMQENIGGLPILDERHKHMVELNVKLKSGQDQDPNWREKIELMHQAYYTLSKRYAYTRSEDKILVFCTNMNNCIIVGTTKTSVAKFWPGAGALKKTEDSFAEYVLSPSQIEKSKFIWEPIFIEGLSGKNFNKIRVFS